LFLTMLDEPRFRVPNSRSLEFEKGLRRRPRVTGALTKSLFPYLIEESLLIVA
jgi:hypothetical protein